MTRDNTVNIVNATELCPLKVVDVHFMYIVTIKVIIEYAIMICI